ncbi:MAG: uroporphyrinogen-III synthase [Gammaproteobacteria bacterium]|nr:uroporphyrinogen-III synthase [Gammaproteobacteria bacterium]
MTNNALAGLNVLITRPEPKATQLAKLIQAEGGQAFVWPCIKILSGKDPVATQSALHNLSSGTIAIFVSPNAVKFTFGADFSKAGIMWVAVGAGTAEALRQRGCSPVYSPPQANSEAVLELLLLQNVQGVSVVIFRGESGRELIKETLERRGAKVSYVEAYQRVKPKFDSEKLHRAWQNQAFDLVISTSTEALQNLLEQIVALPANLRAKAALTAMNEKMLHLAIQNGFQPMLIDSAENMALLSYLKRFWHERQ